MAISIGLSVLFAALVFPWFPPTLSNYSGVPLWISWIVFLLAAPLLEPQFCTAAIARFILRGDPRRPAILRGAIGGAFVYVGTELIYPKLFFDTVGQGLYPSALLRQAAALAGVHGLTLAALLISEAALAARRQPRAISAAVLPLAAWLTYGALRLSTPPEPNARPFSIAVVQANITAYDKLRAEKGAYQTVRLILDRHIELSDRLITEHQPDLLIWPETVYPTTFGTPKSSAGAELDRELETFATTRRISFVFGAYDVEGTDEYNAAFFLAPPKREVYRKHNLFPLTEHVPKFLDIPTFRAAFPWAGTWSKSRGGGRLIQLEDTTMLPLICYDALIPSFAAEAADVGAHLIVTLSNDAWFIDDRAPRLHLYSAAFRSIETGLPQVRATNSGISAMIAADGELTSVIDWNTSDARIMHATLGARARPPAITWIPRAPGIALAVVLVAFAARIRAGTRGSRERRPNTR